MNKEQYVQEDFLWELKRLIQDDIIGSIEEKQQKQ